MSTTNGTPEWVKNMLSKYTSGVAHAFILHFNVNDYVVPGVTLKSYLGKILASREIVAFYNRAEGITFSIPSMKDKFMQALGLSQEQDPALAALAGLSGAQEQELPKSPAAALPLLERLLKLMLPGDDMLGTTSNPRKSAAVVVEFAETIVPSADTAAMSADDRTVLVTLERWGRDPQIQATGNPVFLITSNLTDLHSSIRAASTKYEAVEMPLPDRDARLKFISWYLEQRADISVEDMSLDEFANATAGLSLVHIEDIFLRAAQEGALTRSLVRERKQDIIASEFGEVLEILEPRFGFEMIGGLQHVKDFFTRSVIAPIQAGNTARVPMGVLMTGPAGTGKTAVAEAVAKESGVNCAILNPAKLFGQYVGNTERNLDKALRAVESLAPVIVFIDEIDQAISRGGGGDSGVSNRFFKRIMEFMSDTGHRGRVVFLAATNRPDLMDAALRRPGRFDKKIPFLAPDESEREAIFEVMSRKYGISIKSIPTACVTATNGWTGAEIEAAVVKAIEVMEDQGLTAQKALTYAVNTISPSTADIEYMTLLAVKECNDRDLLPPKYREMLTDRKALDQKLSETRPVEARGRREL
jgi:transitional endoplasmic reticulum ATPase